eukprot:COSAG01_NODE_5325_length_4333_cov_27.694851_5_plen_157_part_00
MSVKSVANTVVPISWRRASIFANRAGCAAFKLVVSDSSLWYQGNYQRKDWEEPPWHKGYQRKVQGKRTPKDQTDNHLRTTGSDQAWNAFCWGKSSIASNRPPVGTAACLSQTVKILIQYRSRCAFLPGSTAPSTIFIIFPSVTLVAMSAASFTASG